LDGLFELEAMHATAERHVNIAADNRIEFRRHQCAFGCKARGAASRPLK
jgi:hypothetical protein